MVNAYLQSVYDTVVIKDIVQRFNNFATCEKKICVCQKKAVILYPK